MNEAIKTAIAIVGSQKKTWRCLQRFSAGCF